jgi:tail assembly protein
MSNVFTLESLNEEIEQKYAPLVFQAGDTEFTLVSLLRVDKKVRAAVREKMESLDKGQDEDGKDIETTEDETIEAFKFILKSVTKDNKGSALVRLLGDDLLKYSTLMEHWQEATQSGEASSSPS